MKKGKKKWRRHVADVVERLIAALEPDEVVLGGGNAKELKELPPKCRIGDNRNAFRGGFRLWEEARRTQQLGSYRIHSKAVDKKGQRRWQHAQKQSPGGHR